MANTKDFKVKNGIQPTVYNEGVGTVTSSQIISFGDSTHTNNSMLTGGNISNPTGMFFKPDGTKLYFMDITDDYLAQFDLSTAWDLTTATWASKTSLVSNEMNSPEGIYIKPDGTKFYVVGRDWNRVFQYSLTTAWDASTGSYDSKYFSYSTEEQYGKGLWFKSDGTKMYITGWNNATIFQYSLSTAWDVSTASYDSVSLALTGMASPRSLAFSTDGTYIMSSDYQSSVVNVYFWKLGTAWDLSTVTETSVVDITSTFSIPPAGVSFKYNDPEKFYVTAIGNPDGLYEFSSVINSASLNLSTGAVFDYTPTSDVKITLSNTAATGTVSQATVIINGTDTSGVSSNFSTDAYTGTSSSQTFSNGLDLSTDGGLVWVKSRSSALNHYLYDTERGTTAGLNSNLINAESTQGNSLTSFNTDGFTLGGSVYTNYSGETYVAWSFKEEPGFFDIVTYTGTGGARNISHSLNSTVGTMIIKRTDTTQPWYVYHRGIDFSNTFVLLTLDSDSDANANKELLNSTEPTSSVFSVNSDLNTSGGDYVAYLFADNSNKRIKCDYYTGNGTSNGSNSVNVGFEPQWILIKNASANSTNWYILDDQRLLQPEGVDGYLSPNIDLAENVSTDLVSVTSTGFNLRNATLVNTSNQTYVYIAIGKAGEATITYDDAIEWAGGTAPTSPGIGETDVITISTRDGGTTYQAVQAIDGAK